MRVRLMLVDDHTMFREALRLMLEKEPDFDVVGELSDGSKIVETVGQLMPDVVLMDVSMPNVNGIEATRRIFRLYPAVHVIALSAYNYKQFIMEMVDSGAKGYVVKSAAGDKLVDAIRSVMQGKTYLCSDAAQIVLETSRRGTTTEHGNGAPNKRLGRRETEVLRLLAQGRSSPQIAQALHIAPSTVDVHRRNIMQKLDLRGIAELTKYAVRVGLAEF